MCICAWCVSEDSVGVYVCENGIGVYECVRMVLVCMCVCVCMYVCVCVCVCVCVYVYQSTHTTVHVPEDWLFLKAYRPSYKTTVLGVAIVMSSPH